MNDERRWMDDPPENGEVCLVARLRRKDVRKLYESVDFHFTLMGNAEPENRKRVEALRQWLHMALLEFSLHD